MALLMACSAFFSCSEAALFYLGREQREDMAKGSVGARTAAQLLKNPERLLSAILFWNLVINIAYFTLTSVISLGLERNGHSYESKLVVVGSLLIIIVFSEMVPKNVGVIWPQALASLVSVPLAAATRVLDPLTPLLRSITQFSERLLIPRFTPEPVLELRDLERAISLSTSDAELMNQERVVLNRIVGLSDATVEEVMRPRRRYLAFSPPVVAADLNSRTTPSGYILITESDSDEIAAALRIDRAATLADARLDPHAKPVVYAPWCAPAASVLGELQKKGRQVAAVLNELGETVGIVTIDDLLDDVLQQETARSRRHDRTSRIEVSSSGDLTVTGSTTLRRIAKHLQVELPSTKGITVLGMLTEVLQRHPEIDEQVTWGGYSWTTIKRDGEFDITVLVSNKPTSSSTENLD